MLTAKLKYFCLYYWRFIPRLFFSIWFWSAIVIAFYFAIEECHSTECSFSYYEWCNSTGCNYTQHQWWKGFYEITSKILLAFIASLPFYFVVVFIPEWRKRRIIKSNLLRMYKNIKRSILQNILWASNSGGAQGLEADNAQIERLMITKEFKAVFSGDKESDQRWYAFLNGLEDSEVQFNDIILNLRLLAKQLDFTLQHCPKLTEEGFNFLKTLESNIDYIVETKFTDCDKKILCRFLWEMFAGWYVIGGDYGYDPFEKEIERI